MRKIESFYVFYGTFLKRIIRGDLPIHRLCMIFMILSSACFASEPNKSRYIGIDEIQAGMKGYCLSCFKDTEVEKFDLEVLSVVRNMTPGRDAILVKSTDERFIHAGLIGGVSGSPVYIQDRLAGAMSFGWPDSKDPVYGVTPIKDMLNVRNELSLNLPEATESSAIDFSKPINLLELSKTNQSLFEKKSRSGSAWPLLTCPVVAAGMPESVVSQLDAVFENRSLKAVTAPVGSFPVITNSSSSLSNVAKSSKLSAGSPLIIPLVIGDMVIAVVGTVTEVTGNDVYGFGHSFLGYGQIDLPMATGEVHTIIAGNTRSFKLASPLEIVGALKVDQSAAVFGQIGAQAYMFPVNVKIDRYNDSEQRQFRCQVANNRLYTPSLVALVISGAALYQGDFPPDNMIEYDVSIKIRDFDPIVFKNVSTGTDVAAVFTETLNAVRLLMNNPFKNVVVESVDVEIRIRPENISSHIWSAEVSDTKVSPGQKVRVGVVLEPIREPKKQYSFDLTIPENLQPGTYELIICGTEQYLRLLDQLAPYRFVAQSFDTLLAAMRDVLSFERDDLYCVLLLPSGGVVIEKAEMSDLPPTKALVLSDAKRALVTQPARAWLEQKVKTGTIIVDKKILHLNVVEE